MVEKHSNTETQLQCSRANNSRVAWYWQHEAVYCGGWSGTSLPCSSFHFQAVGSLAQIDPLVGFSILEPDKLPRARFSLCNLCWEPLSRQMLLGKSSLSTDYSVEDPAGSLQYEIPWNVTWISAEISWVGITSILHVFICGFFWKLLRIGVPMWRI